MDVGGLVITDKGELLLVGVDQISALDSNGLRLTDDGGNLGVFIEDGGFVGVGLADPTTAFEVYGATHCDLTVTSPSTGRSSTILRNANQNWRLQLTSGDDSNFSVRDGTLGANRFTIEPGLAADSLYVASTGYIGIQTNSPAAHLHIADANTPVVAFLMTNQYSGVTGSDGFYITLDGDLNVVISNNENASLTLSTNQSPRIYISEGGKVFINDTINTNMDLGLTINQGAADNEAFAVKSSDVGHGLTSIAETDTYVSFSKAFSDSGGLAFRVIAEDTAAVFPVIQIAAYGGTPNTGISDEGIGVVDIVVAEHDGANSLSNVTANGNLFSVRGRSGGTTPTVFLVNIDGDVYATGNLYVNNARYAYFRDNAGTGWLRTIGVTTSDGVLIGESDTAEVKIANNVAFTLGAAASDFSTWMTNAGIILDKKGDDTAAIILANTTDIDHGLTSLVSTNTWFQIEKANASLGGTRFYVVAEDAALSNPFVIHVYGGTAETTKSTSGKGMLDLQFAEHDGADSLANITANGNLVSFRAMVSGSLEARWLLDEDGDTWQKGSATFAGTKDSASVANQVTLGGYEIGAGNRVLAISQETAVAAETDETKFSHKMQVRINGSTYYIMLTDS